MTRCARQAAVAAVAIATVVAIGSPARAERAPSMAERVAARVEGALDLVEALERELDDAGAWIDDSWQWLDGVTMWEIRNGVTAGWLRDAATAIDTVLGYVDPVGALPRFELARYRILTARPVDGELTSRFGYRYHPVLGYRKRHTGCDYDGDRGDPVRAAAPGLVVTARRWSSYGKIVIIDHGMGVETRYAHLSKLQVSEGEFVTAGARIGSVGSTGLATGPHLHFEVRLDGEAVDPELAFLQRPPADQTRERDDPLAEYNRRRDRRYW